MKRLAGAFVFVVMMVVAAAAWILATESGLRFVARLIPNVTGGVVHIGAATGRLLGPLHIEGVSVAAPRARVEIASIDVSELDLKFDAKPWRIDRVVVRDLRVYPHPSNDPVRLPKPLPALRTPIPLDITHARVEGLTVVMPTRSYPIFHVAQGPLFWREHQVSFETLTADFPQVHAVLSGLIEFRGNWPTHASATWRWDVPAMNPWKGSASLSGDFLHATVTSRVEAPFRAVVNGVAQDVVNGIRWRANANVTPQSLRRLNDSWPEWFISGVIDAGGKLADFNVRANVLNISESFVTRTNIETSWDGAHARVTRAVTQSPGYSGEARTDGDITFGAPAMRFKLNTRWGGITWPIGAQWLRSTEGRARVSGTLKDYEVEMQGDAAAFALPPVNVTAHGKGNAQGLKLSQVHMYMPNDAARAQGAVSFQWQPKPSFDLDLQILRAAWPLDRAPAIFAHNGTLRIRGQPDGYTISLNSGVTGPNLPEGRFDLAAKGDRNKLDVERMTLDTLGGTVAAHAGMVFSQPLQWRFAARGADINPAGIHPQWPGALDFSLLANTTSGDAIEIDMREVSGTLRQQRVIGTAQIEVSAQGDVSLHPALIRLGEGYALVEGKAGNNWELSWAASLPDLNRLDTELAGSLTSVGSLSGEWNHLRVGGQLQTHNFAWRDLLRIEDGQADIDADLSAHDPSRLQITLTNGMVKGTPIDRVTLSGHGTGADHALDVLVQSREDRGTLHVSGALRPEQWELTLEDGQLASSILGNWQTSGPARWVMTREEQRLEQWCWTQTKAGLCMRGSWHEIVGWHAELNGNQVPLQILARWLPPDVATSGGINISARADQNASGAFTARARIVSERGALRFELAPQETTEVTYRNASIDLMSSDRNVAARIDVQFPNTGFIQGNVGIVGAYGDAAAARLSGELRASVNRLDFVPALIPDVAEPRGEVKGVMRLSGSLEQPSLTVHGELKGEARLLRPGLHLRNIVGRITGNTTNGLAFTFGAESGPGSLKAAGRFNAANSGTWNTQMGITGANFQVVNTDEASALVSPDLSLEISPKSIRVDGVVMVPEARVNLQRVENAITPSADVILLGDDPEKAEFSLPKLTSVVRVELGDRIRVEGFGLSARLGGNLALIDEPNRPTHGVGEIMIAEGSYNLEKLYGAFAGLAEKEITINRGRLIFPNIPLEDPALDVRASRVTGEVTAGVTVRGTLQHPQITPFSVPVMSHSDALSYLLYGLPLSQASAEEGQALYTIAASAAASGSALLANQVIRILGLPFDSARVENDPTTGGSVVVVGKYLSPRLYVSYGRGLAEQLNTFRLRYQLSSKWAIEADTSNEQQSGADVVYTIESGP